MRLYQIGAQSLWLDEVLSVKVARQIAAGEGGPQLLNHHGPLYFHVLAPFVAYKTDERVIRFPSALFGVGLVAVAYFLGAALLGPAGGAVAAVVAALSPFAIWYSQEARYLSLALLLSALSLLYADRLARRGRGGDLAGYAAASLLMLFSFVGAVFVIVAQNLWWLLSGSWRRHAGRWIAAQAIVGCLFVPWLLYAYLHAGGAAGRTPGTGAATATFDAGSRREISPAHLAYAAYAFGVGFSLGPTNRALHEETSLRALRGSWPEVLIASAALGSLALAGLIALWRRDAARAGLILASLLVPLLGVYAVALATPVAFNVRYAAGAFPAFIMLLTAGTALCLERRGWALALPAVALLVWSVSLWNHYADPRYAKDDNRGAARLLRKHRAAGEPLVFGSGGKRALDYYDGGPAINWDETRLEVLAPGAPAGDGAHQGRFWLVSCRPWQVEGFAAYVDQVKRCFTAEQTFERPGYEITLFSPPGSGATSRCALHLPPSGP
jgi:uncharacterized membrane protein